MGFSAPTLDKPASRNGASHRTAPSQVAHKAVLPQLRPSRISLQRKCAACEDEQKLQPKLAISEPGNALEREADDVADRVMRMPAGVEASRTPPLSLQRQGGGGAPQAVPAIVHDVLGTPGEPLDARARAFMEPRFGVDFGAVRIHTDADADRSAQSVGALAYTVGAHVAFAQGQYAPSSEGGRRLLAHELAHTVQQGRSTPALQRKCGTDLGSPVPECTPSTKDVSGEHFLFNVNCDELKPGEDNHVTNFVKGLKPGTKLQVHGFASEEGSPDFNLALSCHRVNTLTGRLQLANPGTGPALNITGFFKHGAVPGAARDFWRAATVETTEPPPKPEPEPDPEPKPKKPEGTPGGGIDDCSTDHKQEIKYAFAAARNGIAAVADAIMKDPMDATTKAAFTKYMGATAKPAHVAINLRAIGRGLKDVTIECENPGSLGYNHFCPPDAQAYTRSIAWWVGLGNIHLCQPQFHNSTENQRAGTLVHEGSHRFNGTSDKAYFTLNCQDTAETTALSDSDRDDNADCYGCLVQTLL